MQGPLAGLFLVCGGNMLANLYNTTTKVEEKNCCWGRQSAAFSA